jgi:hypothetical protein
MRLTGTVAGTREIRIAYRMLGLKGRKSLEVERIISKWILIGWKAVGWIHLAQDRIHWRVLVNTVMNLRVQEKFAYILSN